MGNQGPPTERCVPYVIVMCHVNVMLDVITAACLLAHTQWPRLEGRDLELLGMWPYCPVSRFTALVAPDEPRRCVCAHESLETTMKCNIMCIG